MRFGFLLFGLALLPVAVQAETIDVMVQRPAVEADVYLLKSLAVDRFAGSDGDAFANMLERELGRLRGPDGAQLYGLFQGGAGEGIVSGRAEIVLDEARFVEKRKLCPGTFDPKAKCDDAAKAEVEVNCRTRNVALEADVRIVRAADGRVVLNRALPQRIEGRWCTGDAKQEELESVVTILMHRALDQSVPDLAPFARPIALRIREDRKGLDKASAQQFKAAVEATRGEGREGCRLFQALEASMADHRPLIYNLALCAEAAGNYASAAEGFRRVGDREANNAAFRAEQTAAAIALTNQRRGE